MRNMLTRAIVASALLFSACSAGASGTWQETLQARDINKDGIADAYYDTALDITWLADANALAGSSFDDVTDGLNSSTSDGLTSLGNARAWANQLKVFGVTGWRLASSGFRFDGLGTGINELDHLYRVTLGNEYIQSPNGGLKERGPFLNIQNGLYAKYWIESDPDLDWYAWLFYMNGAGWGGGFENEASYTWAVHDGDILAVPEISTSLMYMLGLLAISLSCSRSLGHPRHGLMNYQRGRTVISA